MAFTYCKWNSSPRSASSVLILIIEYPSHPLSKIPSRSRHSDCRNQELPVSLLTLSFAVPSLASPVFTSIGLFHWLCLPAPPLDWQPSLRLFTLALTKNALGHCFWNCPSWICSEIWAKGPGPMPAQGVGIGFSWACRTFQISLIC